MSGFAAMGLPRPADVPVEAGSAMLKSEVFTEIITKLITEIERRGLEEEGLYRVSGSYVNSKQLKGKLLAGVTDKTAAMLEAVQNVHELTTTLKQTLRELNPPLLTYEAYDRWKAAAAEENPLQRNQDVASVLRSLPGEHIKLTGILINHLRAVAAKRQQNKMDIPNLSLVFGPNLLRSPKGALNDLRDTTYQTGIVMILIKAPPGSDVDQLMQVAINPSAAVAPRRKMSYPKLSDPSIQAAMDTMVNTDTLSTEDAFKLFDIDGDGEISVEELTLILRAQGHLMSKKEIEQLMADIDLNGDGAIDMNEFQMAATHQILKADAGDAIPDQEKVQSSVKTFATFDVGGSTPSGSLTKAEVEYICRTYGDGEQFTHEEIGLLMAELGLGNANADSAFEYARWVEALAPSLIDTSGKHFKR